MGKGDVGDGLLWVLCTVLYLEGVVVDGLWAVVVCVGALVGMGGGGGGGVGVGLWGGGGGGKAYKQDFTIFNCYLPTARSVADAVPTFKTLG